LAHAREDARSAAVIGEIGRWVRADFPQQARGRRQFIVEPMPVNRARPTVLAAILPTQSAVALR